MSRAIHENVYRRSAAKAQRLPSFIKPINPSSAFRSEDVISSLARHRVFRKRWLCPLLQCWFDD
jgi:hypothetical protein